MGNIIVLIWQWEIILFHIYDKDGGFSSKFSVWLYRATHSSTWGYDINETSGGDFNLGGVNSSGELELITTRHDSPFHTAGGNLWNSDFRRNITGDAFQLSVGFDANVFAGVGKSVNATWLLSGKDASFFPYIGSEVKASLSDGIDLSVGVTASKSRHTGSVRDITANSLNGPSYGGSIGGKLVVGGSIGYNYSPDGSYGWHTVSTEIGAGVSLSPATAVNVKAEATYTLIQAHTGGNGFFRSDFLK